MAQIKILIFICRCWYTGATVAVLPRSVGLLRFRSTQTLLFVIAVVLHTCPGVQFNPLISPWRWWWSGQARLLPSGWVLSRGSCYPQTGKVWHFVQAVRKVAVLFCLDVPPPPTRVFWAGIAGWELSKLPAASYASLHKTRLALFNLIREVRSDVGQKGEMGSKNQIFYFSPCPSSASVIGT